MRRVINKSKELYNKYERHISSIALVVGFIIDSLTLRRIDQLFENAVLMSYIVIAGLGILLLNLYSGDAIKGKFWEKIHTVLPVAVQFAFGGIFSAFLVFYFRSSSIAASWLFMMILAAVFVGNETFKKYYEQMIFQLSVYFSTLFLFFIFYIPVLVKMMGDWVFLLSGIVSLAALALFVRMLAIFIPQRVKASRVHLLVSIISIYAVITILYFANIIPPIPLALQDVGVYHSVLRIPEGYAVEAEQSWQRPGLLDYFSRQTVHVLPGQPVYVYSAIFAPTGLGTNIVYHWQVYNDTKREWITQNRLEFPIVGGRGEGYRGYSQKSNIFPGAWRVVIRTAGGQVLGRIAFNVEYSNQPPVLETIVKD